MAAKKKKSWRRTVTERVLDALIDAHGDPGNHDYYDTAVDYEAMIVALDGWISFPAPYEDQVLDVGAEIEALLEQSLNPYLLIVRTLSARGVANACDSQIAFAMADQREEDYAIALKLRADDIESGSVDIAEDYGYVPGTLTEASKAAVAACLRKEAKKWR